MAGGGVDARAVDDVCKIARARESMERAHNRIFGNAGDRDQAVCVRPTRRRPCHRAQQRQGCRRPEYWRGCSRLQGGCRGREWCRAPGLGSRSGSREEMSTPQRKLPPALKGDAVGDRACADGALEAGADESLLDGAGALLDAGDSDRSATRLSKDEGRPARQLVRGTWRAEGLASSGPSAVSKLSGRPVKHELPEVTGHLPEHVFTRMSTVTGVPWGARSWSSHSLDKAGARSNNAAWVCRFWSITRPSACHFASPGLLRGIFARRLSAWLSNNGVCKFKSNL